MTVASGVEWREWGQAAFDEAREAGRPVLLSGFASWCADSRTLHDRVLMDAGIVAMIRDRLVPVRFDADRLPHVRDRYNTGGWPITALLTPDGDLLWAGAAPTPEHFRSYAGRALDAWAERRSELEAEIRRRSFATDASLGRNRTAGIVRREAADDVLTAAQATFDERNGGFGESWKLVPPDIIELLFAQAHEKENPDWGEMACRTLDGMLAGEIHDAERGGFFRLARSADWTDPSTEKLLEANAWAVRAFAVGAHLVDRKDWREAVERTVAWADETLVLEDGLWAGSHAAADAWYADAKAPKGDAPAIDRTVFTDATAQWIASLAEAGGRFGKDAWIRRAADALDTLVDSMQAPDGTFHHYRPEGGDPAVHGLLSDVAEVARASLVVAQATGDGRWIERATAIAGVLRDRFWSDQGGFDDLVRGADRPGALRHSSRPFESNAVAAGVLVDLSMLEGGRAWRALAERTLALLSPLAGHYGIGAAGFALAVERYFESPRTVVVVGKGTDARKLRRAALELPLPERQVWTLPEGGEVAGRRFEPSDTAVAFACSARRCSPPISQAAELQVANPS